MKTQKRWVEKGVNLDLLSESIESFFSSKGFKIRKQALPEGYRISIVPQHVHNVKKGIDITVIGHPRDFMIELSVSDLSRSSTMLGLSTTLFGGGIFVLQGLKLQEELERLEKEFWMYVEETIVRMAS